MNLQGKFGLILGVGNQKSIAWKVAEVCVDQGATIALTYLPHPKKIFENNVRKLAHKLNIDLIFPCDVLAEEHIAALQHELTQSWGKLDFLVHSLAYAEQEDLHNVFSHTTKKGFLLALEISAYSFISLSHAMHSLLSQSAGGSITTLSFIGSTLATPNYQVMGPAKASLEASVRYLAREYGPENIRVNAVSAGVLRTLSAMGIKDFSTMQKHVQQQTALQRNITVEEVANTVTFLSSAYASGITGQTIYVDGGYSIMGH